MSESASSSILSESPASPTPAYIGQSYEHAEDVEEESQEIYDNEDGQDEDDGETGSELEGDSEEDENGDQQPAVTVGASHPSNSNQNSTIQGGTYTNLEVQLDKNWSSKTYQNKISKLGLIGFLEKYPQYSSSSVAFFRGRSKEELADEVVLVHKKVNQALNSQSKHTAQKAHTKAGLAPGTKRSRDDDNRDESDDEQGHEHPRKKVKSNESSPLSTTAASDNEQSSTDEEGHDEEESQEYKKCRAALIMIKRVALKDIRNARDPSTTGKDIRMSDHEYEDEKDLVPKHTRVTMLVTASGTPIMTLESYVHVADILRYRATVRAWKNESKAQKGRKKDPKLKDAEVNYKKSITKLVEELVKKRNKEGLENKQVARALVESIFEL